jgi:ketosteroid isomerase-like protein
MDRFAEIDIKLACQDLVARYCMAVNQWDLDAFLSVWAADAVWQRPLGPAINGHSGIRELMEQRPSNRVLRHVNGATLVEVIDVDHAHGWSQTVCYDSVGSTEIPAPLDLPTMVVEYVDEYERRDGVWLICRRDTSWVFLSDADTVSEADRARYS